MSKGRGGISKLLTSVLTLGAGLPQLPMLNHKPQHANEIRTGGIGLDGSYTKGYSGNGRRTPKKESRLHKRMLHRQRNKSN